MLFDFFGLSPAEFGQVYLLAVDAVAVVFIILFVLLVTGRLDRFI